jgi:hypothetical protein
MGEASSQGSLARATEREGGKGRERDSNPLGLEKARGFWVHAYNGVLMERLFLHSFIRVFTHDKSDSGS